MIRNTESMRGDQVANSIVVSPLNLDWLVDSIKAHPPPFRNDEGGFGFKLLRTRPDAFQDGRYETLQGLRASWGSQVQGQCPIEKEEHMKIHRCLISGSVGLGISFLTCPAFAQQYLCSLLPSQAVLRTALQTAVAASNGGLGNNMWATLVAIDGTVCAVAFSGASIRISGLAAGSSPRKRQIPQTVSA